MCRVLALLLPGGRRRRPPSGPPNIPTPPEAPVDWTSDYIVVTAGQSNCQGWALTANSYPEGRFTSPAVPYFTTLEDPLKLQLVAPDPGSVWPLLARELRIVTPGLGEDLPYRTGVCVALQASAES